MRKIDTYNQLRSVKVVDLGDGLKVYYTMIPQQGGAELARAMKGACGFNYDDADLIQSDSAGSEKKFDVGQVAREATFACYGWTCEVVVKMDDCESEYAVELEH